MIDLTEHDKRVLQNVGHAAYGRELTDIMRKIKAQLCSLDGLERGTDHNAAVEGRLLFKDFCDELVKHLSREERPKGTLRHEDYE